MMIQFLSDNALSPCAFFLLGVVLFLVAVRLWSTRGRSRAPIVLAALAFVAAAVPAAVPFPLALTNTALIKLPAAPLITSYPILRLGVNAVGDAPISWWYQQAGTCSANGMTADVGSCNNSTNDSNSFVAAFPTGGDVREWGIKFDNSTDNSTGMQAAFAWAAKGNKLSLPATLRPALFGTGVAVTLTTGATATFAGAGAELSFLEYTGSSGAAITVTYPDYGESTHWRDFTVLPSTEGGANGIVLTETLTTSVDNAPLNDFTNVSFHDPAGYGIGATKYFNKAIDIVGVSYINFYGIMEEGPWATGAYVTVGTGVVLEGGTASRIPVAYNFYGSNLNAIGSGIVLGDYVQGVTVNPGNNLVGGQFGITTVNSPPTGIDGVLVNGVQSNESVAGIYFASSALHPVAAPTIVNSQFLIPSGAYGIVGQGLAAADISTNLFYALVTGSGVGVLANYDYIMEANASIIATNSLEDLAVGVDLGSSTSVWNVSANVYSNNTVNVSNSGTSNKGTDPSPLAFTSTLGCGSGTLGSGNSATVYYNIIGGALWISSMNITVGASGVGSCGAYLTATMPVAARLEGFISGKETVVDGHSVSGVINPATALLAITKYDGTFPIANNNVLTLGGQYAIVP